MEGFRWAAIVAFGCTWAVGCGILGLLVFSGCKKVVDPVVAHADSTYVRGHLGADGYSRGRSSETPRLVLESHAP